jgi:hypothetical protein
MNRSTFTNKIQTNKRKENSNSNRNSWRRLEVLAETGSLCWLRPPGAHGRRMTLARSATATATATATDSNNLAVVLLRPSSRRRAPPSPRHSDPRSAQTQRLCEGLGTVARVAPAPRLFLAARTHKREGPTNPVTFAVSTSCQVATMQQAAASDFRSRLKQPASAGATRVQGPFHPKW